MKKPRRFRRGLAFDAGVRNLARDISRQPGLGGAESHVHKGRESAHAAKLAGT